MIQNSFLHDVSELHFDRYKPQDVDEALNVTEKQARARIEALVALPDEHRTFANTVQALSDASDELDALYGIVDHLANVLGGEWQEQQTAIVPRITAYHADQLLDPRLYKAVLHIQNQQSQLKLSPPQRRLVDDIVTSFQRNGVALPSDKKTRIKQIQTELSSLSTEFSQNIVKANDAAYLHIQSPDELSGIDTDHLEAWHEAAKQKQLEGYFIQFSPPNYSLIMTFCAVRATREAMHKLSRSRAAENEAIALKKLTLRRELAHILGYKNFADYQTEERMAKSGERAQRFIDDLTRHYKPVMLKEGKELEAFIQKSTNDPKARLHYTDVDGGTPLYFANLLRTQKLGFNEDTVREYFPLEIVLDGLFETLGVLYGISFKKADVATPHPDVQAYHMYDEQQRQLATVWCDWLARKGKQIGAWEHTMYVADRANGTTDKPLLAMVCANFAAPTKSKPSLLDIRDVETMWHEFGHFIHSALGKTELREHNGYGCMWDFIEAPSQIMENWIWEPEVLKKISKHYKTGKPLPNNLIERMIKARTFQTATTAMWTLYWSTLDNLLHTSFEGKESIVTLSQKLKNQFFAAPMASYDIGICNFSHIFAGGYAAGYYGYKWAESIEADLFSRFKQEGVLNPATGRAYRDKILARGDEVDPDVLIRDFLDRDSTPKAMLQRDGIENNHS